MVFGDELVGDADLVGDGIAVEVIASAANDSREMTSAVAAGAFLADAIASVASAARPGATSVGRQDWSTF